MPRDISYDPATQTLHVGTGRIRPVPPQVWDYEVSGMKVIRKWFDYRKKKPRVRWSSPLDEDHAQRWLPGFTSELLDLLNVLALCTDLELRQADLLDRVCGGQLITVAELECARVLPIPARATQPPARSTRTLLCCSDFSNAPSRQNYYTEEMNHFMAGCGTALSAGSRGGCRPASVGVARAGLGAVDVGVVTV